MKKIDYSSYFNKSTADIPLLYALYFISIPLAWFFIKLRIKPNTITTFSNINVLISLYFILIKNDIYMFIFFWILALLFDICDGIVSRKTNQQSPHGSFYDHFTDQIKMILLFLSVGIYYDSSQIWILTFTASTLLLLYSLLSYMLKFRTKILSFHIQQQNKKIVEREENVFVLTKRYLYNNFFIIQGNFVVFLSLLFFDNIVIYVFYILIFIILFNLSKSIKYMIDINQKLKENNLKWN